jgi:hypothetical protein
LRPTIIPEVLMILTLALPAPGAWAIDVDPPPDPPPTAELARENDRLRTKIAMLEARLGRLEREADERRGKIQSYRRGLELAVAELNRLNGTGTGAVRLRDAALPERPGLKRWRAVLEREGRDFVVRDTVDNPGTTWRRGTLTVELYCEGRRVDFIHRVVEVPPGGEVPWVHRFQLSGYAAGRLTAWVSFDG